MDNLSPSFANHALRSQPALRSSRGNEAQISTQTEDWSEPPHGGCYEELAQGPPRTRKEKRTQSRHERELSSADAGGEEGEANQMKTSLKNSANELRASMAADVFFTDVVK